MAVAHHVAAHADFGARRRLQEQMRAETGDRLEPEERNVEPRRQGAQLGFGKISVRPLNAAELVDNWRPGCATLHGATEYIRIW